MNTILLSADAKETQTAIAQAIVLVDKKEWEMGHLMLTVRNKLNLKCTSMLNAIGSPGSLELTQEIFNIDFDRDLFTSGIISLVDAFTFHPEHKPKAIRIKNLLEDHGPRIQRMGYSKQTSTWRSFSTKARSPEYISDSEGIPEFIPYLDLVDSKNDEFENTFLQNNAQKALLAQEEPISELKRELIINFNTEFLPFLQLMKVTGGLEYASLYEEVQALVDELNAKTRARRTRKANAKEETEEINQEASGME